MARSAFYKEMAKARREEDQFFRRRGRLPKRDRRGRFISSKKRAKKTNRKKIRRGRPLGPTRAERHAAYKRYVPPIDFCNKAGPRRTYCFLERPHRGKKHRYG